jgi:hypothetical protein
MCVPNLVEPVKSLAWLGKVSPLKSPTCPDRATIRDLAAAVSCLPPSTETRTHGSPTQSFLSQPEFVKLYRNVADRSPRWVRPLSRGSPKAHRPFLGRDPPRLDAGRLQLSNAQANNDRRAPPQNSTTPQKEFEILAGGDVGPDFEKADSDRP